MSLTPGQPARPRPELSTETDPPPRTPPNRAELATRTPDQTIPTDRQLLRLLEGRT